MARVPINNYEIRAYNAFVDCANRKRGLYIESMKVFSGFNQDGKLGLLFKIETVGGLTDEWANYFFKDFLLKFPECGIDYNKPKTSYIEDELTDKSESVIHVHKFIRLSKIRYKNL